MVKYLKAFYFDCRIKKIIESGLMEKWKQLFWLPENACSITGGLGSGFSSSVSVMDMQGSFYILGIGKNIWIYSYYSNFECIIAYFS